MYQRLLNLTELVQKKSVLLLGPRQTGKSTIIQQSFPDAYYVHLAESDVFRELSARPELVRQRLPPQQKILVIDEAQRIPELFNEVQVMLDRSKDLRVVLTGSSARKLKRTGINLLPGRIWQRRLFPLVSAELGESRIEERVVRGSLPAMIDSPDYIEELKQYVGNYLEEEVRAEGLVRGIGSFSRFLTVAALCNTEQVNLTKISNDTGISISTIRTFFDILEDTLLAVKLPVFRKSHSRKAVAIPKFYFFDCGVVNALLGRFEVKPQNELFGKALEHLIFQELWAYLHYSNSSIPLTYWRTHTKFEVDFVLGDSIGIEVKAGNRVVSTDEKGLHALGDEIELKRKIIVCREPIARLSDTGVEIIPVERFLEKLWKGEIAA